MKKDSYNITLPKSWNDITLGMLEQMEGESDNPMKILSILSNTPEDDIAQMPVQFIDSMFKNMEFIKTMPNVAENHSIRYKGNTYMINFMEKLTFGEYVAIQMLLKANQHDYSGFLAVLARKEGEIYNSEFENVTLPERKEMFKNMPVKKALPLVAFFLTFWQRLTSLDKVYSQTKQTTLQEIESILDSTKSSAISGAGKKLSITYAKRRLKRLKKLIDKTF